MKNKVILTFIIIFSIIFWIPGSLLATTISIEMEPNTTGVKVTMTGETFSFWLNTTKYVFKNDEEGKTPLTTSNWVYPGTGGLWQWESVPYSGRWITTTDGSNYQITVSGYYGVRGPGVGGKLKYFKTVRTCSNFTPKLSKISFNYTSSNAISINNVYAPEWTGDVYGNNLTNSPSAYFIGSYISIRVGFILQKAVTERIDTEIYAEGTLGEANIKFGTGIEYVPVTVIFDSGSASTTEYTFNGSIKIDTEVKDKILALTWKYRIKGTSEWKAIQATNHQIYITDLHHITITPQEETKPAGSTVTFTGTTYENQVQIWKDSFYTPSLTYSWVITKDGELVEKKDTGYANTLSYNFPSTGVYTIDTIVGYKTLRIITASGTISNGSNVVKENIFKVEITIPSIWPAEVNKGSSITLGATVTPNIIAGKYPYSWYKISGDGEGTFNPNNAVTAINTSFTGTKEGSLSIQVKYGLSGNEGVSEIREIKVISKIDYIKVKPEKVNIAIGGKTQQFEARGYNNGKDGISNTADDEDIGIVKATWTTSVGTINGETGLFVSGNTVEVGKVTATYNSLTAEAKVYVYKIEIETDPTEALPSGTTTIIVSANAGAGYPISGIEITIDKDVVEKSGGHAHNTERPKGTLDKAEGKTDNGIFTAKYKATEFGGTEVVKATSGDLKVEVKIDVRIPELGLLGEGTNYDLTGGTVFHPLNTNHYGTATMINNLPLIADEYAKKYPNSKLYYNDISLEKGGGFDIKGHWRACITSRELGGDGHGHLSHREGGNVDIRLVPKERQRDLKNIIIDKFNGKIYPEVELNHWHVTF